MEKFKNCLPLLFVLALTAAVYTPVFSSQFTNWDDNRHLTRLNAVQELTWGNVQKIFTSTINFTYIPLTLLSFAVEHHFFKLNPFVYHLDNLLLHLGVVALVYAFGIGLGLSRRAVLLASLIFGVHPMHVESVAWVTERKDVLCAVFYMAAVICYWRYVSTSPTPGVRNFRTPGVGEVDTYRQ